MQEQKQNWAILHEEIAPNSFVLSIHFHFINSNLEYFANFIKMTWGH